MAGRREEKKLLLVVVGRSSSEQNQKPTWTGEVEAVQDTGIDSSRQRTVECGWSYFSRAEGTKCIRAHPNPGKGGVGRARKRGIEKGPFSEKGECVEGRTESGAKQPRGAKGRERRGRGEAAKEARQKEERKWAQGERGRGQGIPAGAQKWLILFN